MLNKIDSILFDLDGTLWETLDTSCASANEVLQKLNLDIVVTKEQVCQGMGKNFEECSQIYLPTLEKEKRANVMKKMLETNTNNLNKIGGNLYDNLEETLRKLKSNYKLYIVSNCCDGYIEAFLNTSHLGKYFDDYIAAGKHNISKSEAILRIIKKYNLKGAIYFGDTYKDYEASREANIPFVQAKYGFGEDLKTEYSVNKIEELAELLKISEKMSN